jgi:hypothetical protein
VEAWHRLVLAELSAEAGDQDTAHAMVDAASELLRRQGSRLAARRVEVLRRSLASR